MKLNFPKPFSSEGEIVPKLKRFKDARQGKWNLCSSRSLHDIGDLIIFLLAGGRYAEGGEIGEFLSRNVHFKGDYNLWSPATYAIAAGARCARQLDQEDKAKEIFLPVLKNPSGILFERKILEQVIRQAPESMPSDALSLTRGHILFLEEAWAGRPGTEWYPIERIEEQLSQALDHIRKKWGISLVSTKSSL